MSAHLSEITGDALEFSPQTMSLKQQIISDMTAAMKAQDAARTSTLRMVKAAIMNREKEGGGELTDEDVLKLLRSQVKQRRDSVEQYEKANRPDLADKEQAEIAMIEGYLPQSASQEEIDQAVVAAIAETGASSMKDMGGVMKATMAKLAGKNADGKMVSETVKAKLATL
ncbi:MAG TPA: GatB/YqeY domain-containing protein [Pyrinomonadaceae bacterium]|nr:GatB/YqeY domain-containing protein [Pyrinomonadaceae bacterium]